MFPFDVSVQRVRLPSIVLLSGGLLLALVLVSSTMPASGASPMDDAEIENLASEIASDAKELGALGAYWDAESNELVVVAPSTGADISADDFLGRGLSVRVEVAAVSEGEFEEAKDQVRALVRDGKLKGESTEVALNLESGQIEIKSTAEESVFADALADLSGRGIFRIAQGEFQRLANRIDDAQPYWGGGRMQRGPAGPQQRVCSSGFTVLRSGTAYMATAGHCFGLGLVIADGGGDSYGTVDFRAWQDGSDLDTELIGGKDYGGHIWLGTDPLNPAWAHVTAANDPVVGFDYCSSGFVSTQLCGLTSTGVDIFDCDPNNNCTDDMLRFAGEDHWTGGDSGGPVFVLWQDFPPMKVRARATIVGEWDGNSYAQQWSAIANKWNVTICTDASGPC